MSEQMTDLHHRITEFAKTNGFPTEYADAVTNAVNRMRDGNIDLVELETFTDVTMAEYERIRGEKNPRWILAGPEYRV